MEQLDLIQIKNPICKIIIRKIVYEEKRESFKHFLWGGSAFGVQCSPKSLFNRRENDVVMSLSFKFLYALPFVDC